MVKPTAVVMNMHYTGLGIARSLGEQGVPVIGLAFHKRVYGAHTRYARTRACPDSRNAPEELLAYLIDLGKELGPGSVLFPTRDDDVVFLDRFRADLQRYFVPVIPPTDAVKASLDKWETFLAAQRAGVPSPKTWCVSDRDAVREVADEVRYPCIVKPIAAHHWRLNANWDLVGRRKAVCVSSKRELIDEYSAVARADKRVLIQEMIPGGDGNLAIAACYLDRNSNFVAGFNTRKLLQVPVGLGTGCIVQAAHQPELFDAAMRLLREIRFSGIAEVEFKWNNSTSEFQLIEINPRPWDQHSLGRSCGTDLIWLAYCEAAGLERPAFASRRSEDKWVAEDAFLEAMLRAVWRGEGSLGSLLRLAQGKRRYAIWSSSDPMPFIAHVTTSLIPRYVGAAARRLWASLRRVVTPGSNDAALRENLMVRGKGRE